MGTPNTWRDYGRISAALERTQLIVRKGANIIRAVPLHIFRSLGTRRLSLSGRWLEMRPALSRFASSPTINSVRSIACELRLPSCRVFEVQLEIRL
jgi:hypothetical protein